MKYSHLITMASIVLAGPAIASSLVVPGPGVGNAQAPTPFNYYGSSGSQVQQIYASSFFPGEELISGFSFRAYPGAAPSFFLSNTVNISDVVIQLSTTSAGADEGGSLPSATFADNLGGDATTVYSGALTLTTAATGIGAQPFDYTVTFSQPFCTIPPPAICCSTSRYQPARWSAARALVFLHSTPSTRSTTEFIASST